MSVHENSGARSAADAAQCRFLTIDNGGTNTKVIIVDGEGRQLAVSSFPTAAVEPRPGFHEVNPEQMWQDIGKSIRAALGKAGLTGGQISGVAPVGHGKGLYTLGEDGRPFMNGILSSDSRATDLANAFESKLDEIYPISHQHVMVMQFPVLLRWLKDHKPEQYERIGYVLSNKDFIRYFLTGQIFEERGDASGNNLVSLDTKQYDERLFDFFGIHEMFDKMPKLVKPTDQCGTITAEASENTGLKEGTPVYAGMFDIDACALATGVLTSDIFSITAGTWNINVFPSAKPASLASGCMNSIFPTGQILVEASSPTSAGNLDDVLKAVYGSKPDYTQLENMLTRTDASSCDVLFLPFLYGSNVNLDAEGAFVGLRSTTTKDQLLRSVYEGVAFAHRQHVEQLFHALGHKPKAIRMSGGACNSKSWVQMFADVLGVPVETVSVTELGGLGGAICSAVGCGLYADFEEAFERMSSLKDRIEPDAAQSAVYDEKYAAYEDVVNAMDSVWKPLRTMQNHLQHKPGVAK